MSVKVEELNANHDEDVEPQSGNSSILQSPSTGPKGNGGSLHYQNQVIDQDSDPGSIKVRKMNPNKNQDAKPHKEPQASSKAQSSGLNGHGGSLPLQNKFREQKLKVQKLNPNHDQDSKLWSGTFSISKAPN